MAPEIMSCKRRSQNLCARAKNEIEKFLVSQGQTIFKEEWQLVRRKEMVFRLTRATFAALAEPGIALVSIAFC